MSRDRYIDGIFNYCDRWCERCPFTRRCRAFAMEKAFRRSAERREKETQAFWLAMEKAVGDGLDEVAKKAKDLARRDDAELKEFEQELTRRQARAERHPLSKMSSNYAQAVQAFFEERGELDGELREPVEVIRWYQHFIQVKLMRALQGLLDQEEERDEPWEEEWPKHSDGSAKLAIIAAERSMGAWSRLRDRERKAALERMVELARIRAMVERVFPRAREFKRPGFDD